MTAAQTKSTPGEAGVENDQESKASKTEQYSQLGKNTSSASKTFTRRKFEWLDQVAADNQLPPICSRLGIVIVNRYLNFETADAWPAIETLARILEVTPNTIRGAFGKMRRRHHILTDFTKGGATNTNHQMPMLIESKPYKNLKGSEVDNPPKSKRETLKIRSEKPPKELKGNSIEDHIEESPPRRRGAPSPPSSSSGYQYAASNVVGNEDQQNDASNKDHQREPLEGAHDDPTASESGERTELTAKLAKKFWELNKLPDEREIQEQAAAFATAMIEEHRPYQDIVEAWLPKARNVQPFKHTDG